MNGLDAPAYVNAATANPATLWVAIPLLLLVAFLILTGGNGPKPPKRRPRPRSTEE